MRFLGIALLTVAILCTISIALLLKPESLDSTSFTLATLWSLFLVTINWTSSVYIFRKTKESTVFGILPSVSNLFLLYSFFSIGLMLFYWNTNNFGQLPTSHWVIQIFGFGVVTSVVLLQFMATKTADVDQRPDLPKKSEMIGLLQNKRVSLGISSKKLRDSITELENLIKHSLPHPAVINDENGYKALSEQITDLANSDMTEAEWLEKIIKLCQMVSVLR